MTRINWYGNQVMKDSKALAWKRVMAAGSFLKARIQRNVDIATAAAGPSKPGEYPHKVTGTLQKSIFLRRRQDMVAVDVGTKLVYGVHWEVTNRPYIRRTYAEQLGQIRAILDGKMVRTLEDVKGEAAEMKERHRAQKERIKERKKLSREVKQLRKKAGRAETKARRASKKVSEKVKNLLAAKKWAEKQKTESGKRMAKGILRRAKSRVRGAAKSAKSAETKSRASKKQFKSKKSKLD